MIFNALAQQQLRSKTLKIEEVIYIPSFKLNA